MGFGPEIFAGLAAGTGAALVFAPGFQVGHWQYGGADGSVDWSVDAGTNSPASPQEITIRILRSMPRYVFLLAAAFFAVIATALIWLKPWDAGQDTPFDEAYPFSTTPEFPRPSDADADAMYHAAASFLKSPQWNKVAISAEVWQLADIAALPRGGARVGVYASVQFDNPVFLDESIGLSGAARLNAGNGKMGRSLL